jgi:hypothetical protein
MTEHYHAAIWIDHREARVFHFSPTDVETLVLNPDNLPRISITRPILSGAGTHRRASTTFARTPNQCRTLARF